jgi:hypothetical protein
MKKLIFLFLFIPFLSKAKAQFTITNTSTISLVELRSGTWPLELDRVVKESDTIYLLQFRDQQYTNEVNMSSLKFGNLQQLKYFQKGLAALKNGSNGDEARFKDYSVKRADVKKEGICYILTGSLGEIINFRQPEADKLMAAIKSL